MGKATKATPKKGVPSGHFRTLTPRAKKSRRWHRAFLTALRASCNVSHAAAAARISRSVVYGERELDPGFARRWEDALTEACDALELEARRRALAGSDVLLIFLLKALRPQIYGERLEHSFRGINLPAAGSVTVAHHNAGAERAPPDGTQ